jgi:hypothetical protein
MAAFCGEPNGMARLQFEVMEEPCMARYKVTSNSPALLPTLGDYAKALAVVEDEILGQANHQ